MRLFPPVFRFDNVYHLRFRLNEALISESYPHLQRWLEEVRAPPERASESRCSFDHDYTIPGTLRLLHQPRRQYLERLG